MEVFFLPTPGLHFQLKCKGNIASIALGLRTLEEESSAPEPAVVVTERSAGLGWAGLAWGGAWVGMGLEQRKKAEKGGSPGDAIVLERSCDHLNGWLLHLESC